MLESQLLKERELYTLRERERRHDSELHDRRRSPRRDERGTSRYESTSVFMEEFLILLRNRNSERDSFPALNDNVIPTFDPLCKEQPINVWLSKVA